MVSSLIAGGAQVEQACLKKWTAMHEASRTGCVPVMELLLQNGGQVSETDQHGVTPLGIAAEYSHAEVLELLIKHGEPLHHTSDMLLSTHHMDGCEGPLVMNSAVLSQAFGFLTHLQSAVRNLYLLITKQQRETSWSGTKIIHSNKKIDLSGVGGGDQTRASKTPKLEARKMAEPDEDRLSELLRQAQAGNTKCGRQKNFIFVFCFCF